MTSTYRKRDNTMTEYDRTPIEATDMQWGDLIVHQDWEGGHMFASELFVGAHPSRPGRIVTIVRSNWEPTSWSDSGPWFKLTPKPEPTLCANCGEKIEQDREYSWFHTRSGLYRCADTYATPATTEA